MRPMVEMHTGATVDSSLGLDGLSASAHEPERQEAIPPAGPQSSLLEQARLLT